MQQSPELSLRYFNEAKQLRYQGNFRAAIELQKQSILVYQNDPDLPMNFYSLGKTYYLNGEYKLSLKSYEVYNNFCVIKNPMILDDYSMIMRSNTSKERFLASFANLAHNIGHTLEDPKNAYKFSQEILWYKNELMGKTSANTSHTVYSSYQKYDEECTLKGFSLIFEWMDKLLSSRNIRQNTINLINSILYS